MNYYTYSTKSPVPRTALLSGLLLLLVLALPNALVSQERWSSGGPAGHSPIGVMGDHTHGEGEWMLSYMFARESMSGLRDGSASLSVDEVWPDYRMVPRTMTMDMHMPHVMYAPSDEVTLMLMGMWMDHRMSVRMENALMAGHGMGGEQGMGGAPQQRAFHNMEHSVTGWADTELSALVKIFDRDRKRIHLNLGVGLPTGSTSAEDPRVVQEHRRLGYPMQLGSGSWEARPGATFLLQTDQVSWGAQGMGVLRLNENDQGWKRGPAARLDTWAMLRGNDRVSPGIRLQARRWGSVEGSDPALDPTISPENDPDLQGGNRIAGYLALNLQVPSGPLAGHRVAFEWGGPLVESLDGPQMSEDWTFNIGWEYSF